MPVKVDIEIPEAFGGLLGDYRHKVMYGGRGSGKSWTVGDYLIARSTRRPLRILCSREVQRSIGDSVHRLLRDRMQHHGLLGTFFRATDTGIVGVNGSQFLYKGLRHDPEGVKSTEGIDVAWVEEAQTVSDSSLDILIPTVRKPGSQLIYTFNPRLKTDAVYQRFVKRPTDEDGRTWVQKVSWRDNPWFPDVLRDEMLALKAEDYDKYLHVWEGELMSFGDGAIYEAQIRKARQENRIGPQPTLTGVPVHTFWDLGRNDHTAIWFVQIVGSWIHLIDYYQNRMKEPEHYAKVLQDRGYVYGTHYQPHDSRQVRMGMGNRSVKRQFEDLGLKDIKVVPRTPDVNIGINLTRQLFPRFRIDEERCEDGLDCLVEYQYKFDELRGTHQQVPLHSWASNGADALRTLGEALKHFGEPESEQLSDRRRERIRKVSGEDLDAYIV